MKNHEWRVSLAQGIDSLAAQKYGSSTATQELFYPL